MKKTRFLIVMLFISCGLFAQNCYDFVQNHFDNVEDLCGYHGGLHFKIQETDLFNDELSLSADFFVEKWLEQKYGEGASFFDFWRNEESEVSPNIMRYNFSYSGYVLDNMVFLLTFDNNGVLRSYNVSCPPKLKTIIKKIAYIAINPFDSGIDESKIINSAKNVKLQEEVLLFTETLKYYNDEFVESKMLIDLIAGEIIYDSNSDGQKGDKQSKSKKQNFTPCENNDAGIIGVSLPVHDYLLASICDIGTTTQSFLAFQASHNYIYGQTIGDSNGTGLRIVCDDVDLRSIDHLENWIECIDEDVDYKHDTNNFLFCSDPGTGSPDLGKLQYTMAYFHLAGFYKYLNSDVIGNTDYSFVAMPSDKIYFNPYDILLSEIYTVTDDNNEKVYINYAAGAIDSGKRPLAEDAHYIIEGGIHAYWEKIMPDHPDPYGSGSDGLFYGAIDYITWRYSSEELGASSTDLLEWGGDPDEFMRSVEISETYSQIIGNPDFASPQKMGQVFSSTLHEIAIDPDLGKEIADFLLYKKLPTMLLLNDQPEGAQMLYDAAETEHTDDLSSNVDIDAVQLCKIAQIIKNRYSTLVATISYDFYIRDSYEGQPINWDNPTPQGEDIGNEPNNITYNFSKSYDIWNKLTQGSTDPNDTEHDRPEYNDGAENFLYVDIRNRGCAILDPDATVHVYLRETHSESIWPDGWTLGFYTGNVPPDPNNPPLDNPMVGYEITSDPNDVTIPMGIPVTQHILHYEDDEGRDVYRYEIPWVPFNPKALPDYDAVKASAWGCLLVRIESDLDPMPANENGVSAWNNNWRSNNYSIRNTSILHISGDPLAPPGEPGEPDISGLNVVSIADADPDDPDDDGTNTNDLIFSILGDEAIGSGNDVFNYIDIELILTNQFLEAWKKGGYQGNGFEWMDKDVIKITDKNFTFKNLKLTRKMPHRVFFKVSQLRSFNNIGFDMTMTDESGCALGGQEFLVQGDSELAIKDQKIKEISKRSSAERFEIHPNPMSTYATITGQSLEKIKSIQVYNSLGEKIELEINKDYKNSIKIDMSDQSSGIYFVSLITEDKVDKVLKFIKL